MQISILVLDSLILSPLLFNYMRLQGEAIHQDGVRCLQYAEDTQLYISSMIIQVIAQSSDAMSGSYEDLMSKEQSQAQSYQNQLSCFVRPCRPGCSPGIRLGDFVNHLD